MKKFQEKIGKQDCANEKKGAGSKIIFITSKTLLALSLHMKVTRIKQVWTAGQGDGLNINPNALYYFPYKFRDDQRKFYKIAG